MHKSLDILRTILCFGSSMLPLFWQQKAVVQLLSPVRLCDPVDGSTPDCPVLQPSPGVRSNPCPLSRWCHPTISSSAVPFFSCLLSFPASGSFQMSLLFASGGQSIGASASASVLPVNIQDWSPVGWTGWISLQSFSKSSLYIWKSLLHILLKPSLKDFEHCLANMWNGCTCTVVWTFSGIVLLWDGNENWPFPVLWPLLSLRHIEWSTLIIPSFRILNSSARIHHLH